MSDYLVTGQRGAGKGVVMTSRMRRAFLEGRIVATNMDIDLGKMFPYGSTDWKLLPKRPVLYRLPDFPSGAEIKSLGFGGVDFREDCFGELILDELQVWLNSRGWDDPKRREFITWLPLSRKYRWHTYFTSQTLNGLDKQVRDLLEHRVHVTRTDRMGFPIPIFGGLLRMIFGRIHIYRVHIGTVSYGAEVPPHIVDTWKYRGTPEVMSCYNTEQKYTSEYPHGVYSVLPSWYWQDNKAQKSYGCWVSSIVPYISPETGKIYDYPGRPESWGSEPPHFPLEPVRPLYDLVNGIFDMLFGRFFQSVLYGQYGGLQIGRAHV